MQMTLPTSHCQITAGKHQVKIIYWCDNGIISYMSAIYLKTVFISILLSLSSGAEDDSEDINEDYDKGYSELNNEIDGQVLKVIDKTKSLKK